MQAIRTVGIISKPGITIATELLPRLVAWLEERGIASRYDEMSAGYLGRTDALSREEVVQGTQLVIVLGGDGTLLAAARAVGGQEIPIFAVNLGALGFLTTITVEEMFPELERVLAGDYRIGKRQMLAGEVYRGDEKIASYKALNDIVLTKAALARVVDVACHVDNHFVCAYKADGLIVATPTGSTAYSLSAGGPIIFPSVGALAITPICPHMLTNRPVIVSDGSVITMTARSGDDDIYLTVDGQVGQPLKKNDRVVCKSANHSVQLIRPPRMLYFDVLRQKLKWGER